MTEYNLLYIAEMADERNFRSNYYDKVGFRTVEEKKSIEVLLKDKPLDVDKLKQYSLRFSVSARYRIYLWKVILGNPNKISYNFSFIHSRYIFPQKISLFLKETFNLTV